MDAYYVEKIISFKTLGIAASCIAAHGDILLAVVDTELREYKAETSFDASKNRDRVGHKCVTHNVFNTVVREMKIVPEINQVLMDYGDGLHVHDFGDNYEHILDIPDTEGLTFFDVLVKEQVDVLKKIQLEIEVQLCLVIGKILKVFEWNGKEYVEKHVDLKLSRPAKAAMWCGDNIVIGFKDEYIIVKPDSGKMKEVFQFGSGQTEPVMLRIPGDLILLGYDVKSLFVNRRGKPDRDAYIQWTTRPRLLFYDSPYVIAVMPKHLEIKSAQPSISIQQIYMKLAKNVCKGREVIYVQTETSVYMLTPRPVEDRVKYLSQHYCFDLAIQIQMQSSEAAGHNQSLINSIRAHQGVYFFCKNKFVESMEIFSRLDTDIHHVIGMVSSLLPSSWRNRIQYPEKIPTLHESDLRLAFEAMDDYLTEKRAAIVSGGEDVFFTPIWPHKDNVTLKTKEEALIVIDTTLLKIYIQIREERVAPLLRQPDNKVHVQAAERALAKSHKYTELIILYEEHGRHADALQVMKNQSKNTKSSLQGFESTIHKLQQLGTAHLNLIYEWSKWVFEVNPYEALQIFTEDVQTVRELPRGHILSFLETLDTLPMIVIQYLEHVIYEWGDQTEELHQALASHLKNAVLKEYQDSRSFHYMPPCDRESGGKETGMLTLYRGKFLRFLNKTSLYQPDHVLTHLPMNGLFEERAVLLGRLKKHEQALGIYVYVLCKIADAEDYCIQHYEGHKDVYLDLLKVYLYPPKPLSLGIQEFRREPKQKLADALAMLETHAAEINLYKAVSILPEDLTIKKLRSFLEVALEAVISQNYMCQVQKKIERQHNIQINILRRELCCKTPIKIADETDCPICKFKIGKTVFVHSPDKTIIHLGCNIQKNTST
ncbi:vam6/Vps39-like protein [Mya arenaria]|uniref:vam6/Vps39-like protein n=1 Tax=Mya arenaria TaxID=6604 RepID=UPI0022E3EEAD|nr:vam6/Vps39-like protein [Mya arenaria]